MVTPLSPQNPTPALPFLSFSERKGRVPRGRERQMRGELMFYTRIYLKIEGRKRQGEMLEIAFL